MAKTFRTSFASGNDGGTDFLVSAASAFKESVRTPIAVRITAAPGAPYADTPPADTDVALTFYQDSIVGPGYVDVSNLAPSYTVAQVREGITVTTTGIDATLLSRSGVFAIVVNGAYLSDYGDPGFVITLAVQAGLTGAAGSKRAHYTG